MSMTGPDTLVDQHGIEIDLVRITDFEINADGQVDEDSIERSVAQLRAIVSDPSEDDEQHLEGRLSTGSIRLTVPSDTDIRADRDGQRDRVRCPAAEGYGHSYGETYSGNQENLLYEVIKVRDDRNPLTSTRKKTVLCDRLGGR